MERQKEAHEFYLGIARSLAGCQLVEQELKLYITEALELARKCIGDRMSFKMSGSDFENEPLGRLIERFAKLNNNTALVKSLKRFKKERDFLSHKAIVDCLDYFEELDHSAAAKMEPRLNKIRWEAEILMRQIHQEFNRVSAQLVFDKIEK